MFKSFTHGERTVNVIISKGEDCGVIKEPVDKLRNIVNNNAKTVKDVANVLALTMLITGAVFYFHSKQLTDLDERVSKLESKQTAEENQEN